MNPGLQIQPNIIYANNSGIVASKYYTISSSSDQKLLFPIQDKSETITDVIFYLSNFSNPCQALTYAYNFSLLSYAGLTAFQTYIPMKVEAPNLFPYAKFTEFESNNNFLTVDFGFNLGSYITNKTDEVSMEIWLPNDLPSCSKFFIPNKSVNKFNKFLYKLKLISIVWEETAIPPNFNITTWPTIPNLYKTLSYEATYGSRIDSIYSPFDNKVYSKNLNVLRKLRLWNFTSSYLTFADLIFYIFRVEDLACQPLFDHPSNPVWLRLKNKDFIYEETKKVIQYRKRDNFTYDFYLTNSVFEEMSNYSLKISVSRMDTVFNPNFFIGFKIPGAFKVNASTSVLLKFGVALRKKTKGIFEEKFDENGQRFYFYRFVLGYDDYLEFGMKSGVRYARLRNVMFYIDINNV